MKLWTVWLDYLATGEGRTKMACFVYALDNFGAINKFQEKFGEYFAQGCQAHEGVLRNTVTKFLFSKAALDGLEDGSGRGSLDAYASIHLEYNPSGQRDMVGSYTGKDI
jgi:hypothetical protein